jgi:hypothetical protein
LPMAITSPTLSRPRPIWRFTPATDVPARQLHHHVVERRLEK